MICRLLSLLCLRLCVGQIGIPENGPPSKPSLSAWPSTVLPTKSNVILRWYLPKPSFQAHHRGTVTAGSTVTLQCQKAGSVLGPIWFALLKVGHSTPVQTRGSAGMVLDFSLQNVTARDAGKYSCVYYQAKAPYRASDPSNLLEISVIDNHLPQDSAASTFPPQPKETSYSESKQTLPLVALVRHLIRSTVSTQGNGFHQCDSTRHLFSFLPTLLCHPPLPLCFLPSPHFSPNVYFIIPLCTFIPS
eukprot:XP_017445414.1 PREDICTED: T-cell-interacting, activating receptor on myeloid cells protein 1-like isoform X1 [Rattus norvegicus]